jgi:hypothetical protein
VQWKLPSQTVMTTDSLVRQVVSPELLERHLGLHFLHSDACSRLTPALVSCLGVETVTTDHLVQVGRSLVASWGDTISDGMCTGNVEITGL